MSVTDPSVSPTAIDGLLHIRAKTVTDDRGTVREMFRTSGYAELGVPVPARWEQVNLTWTKRGAVRGLHGEAADKLIGPASGAVFGAWLDARPGSPTHGAVVTLTLEVGEQVFVPSGVCNGFQALGDPGSEYLYCFGAEWRPGMAGVAVTPLDPALGIAWPIEPDPSDPAMVSAKDAAAPRFEDL
ncbi:dTDP-4-dehydrorhamnose 3,5-epimerase family protein [Jatrophihabitans fulvus]